jgi:hypothetical protein
MNKEKAISIVKRLQDIGNVKGATREYSEYYDQDVFFESEFFPTTLYPENEKIINLLLPMKDVTYIFHNHAEGWYFNIYESNTVKPESEIDKEIARMEIGIDKLYAKHLVEEEAMYAEMGIYKKPTISDILDKMITFN